MAHSEEREIKFVSARVDIEDGHCRAVVELESRTSGVHTGTAQGGPTEADQLLAVARATSDALSEAFEVKNARVRVRTIQLVEGIVHPVVLAFMSASRGAHSQALIGVCDGASDLPTAMALAVLNATNRFLGRD